MSGKERETYQCYLLRFERVDVSRPWRIWVQNVATGEQRRMLSSADLAAFWEAQGLRLDPGDAPPAPLVTGSTIAGPSED